MKARHSTIKAVRLGSDRTAAVAVMIALTAPVLIMFVGMGVELTSWVATRTTLQRTADVAALAGAVSFSETRTALTAANAAADIAEINGAVGALARVWNPTTQTLTDNQVSIQVGTGVRNSQDTGITVTLIQSVPTILIRVLTQMTSVTLKPSQRPMRVCSLVSWHSAPAVRELPARAAAASR